MVAGLKFSSFEFVVLVRSSLANRLQYSRKSVI